MKAVRLILVVCLVLMSASCTLKPAWDIAGKWQKVDGNEIIDLARGGTVTLNNGPTSLKAHYKFNDAKQMQIDLGSLGSLTLQAEIQGDTLTLTDAAGKVSQFKKVK